MKDVWIVDFNDVDQIQIFIDDHNRKIFEIETSI